MGLQDVGEGSPHGSNSQPGAFAAGCSRPTQDQSLDRTSKLSTEGRTLLLTAHTGFSCTGHGTCPLGCQTWIIKGKQDVFLYPSFLEPPPKSSLPSPPPPRRKKKKNQSQPHPHGLPWWGGNELSGTTRPFSWKREQSGAGLCGELSSTQPR